MSNERSLALLSIGRKIPSMVQPAGSGAVASLALGFLSAAVSIRNTVRSDLDRYTLEMSVMRSPWFSLLAFAFCLGVASGQENAASLHDAARTGNVDQIKQLIVQGRDVNGRDDNRETPLIEAALSDQVTAAATLIEAGADVKARNDRGFTALHAAAYSGSTRIAALLLDHGATVDARSMHNITSLHVAAEQNQTAVAELLIARGADVEAVQGDGYTPLSRATFYKSAQVMALLKRHGAQCQPKDKIGSSHAACLAAGN
jgi:uncharacterized protein